MTSQVQELIAELNEILANEVVDENGLWKKKLTEQSLKLFDLLPEAIQEQLMLERDPHGNVQVIDHVSLITDVSCATLIFTYNKKSFLFIKTEKIRKMIS